MAFVDTNGKIIAQFDRTRDRDKAKQGATSEFEILRVDLTEIFLGKMGAVDVVYGCSVESVTQNENGIHATFTGGKAEDANCRKLIPRVISRWRWSGTKKSVSPQTGCGITALNTVLWGVGVTKLYKLFGGLGEISENDWKMPEYKWVRL